MSAGEAMGAVPRDEFDQVQEALGRLATENFKMTEALQNVEMMIDARGWTPIYQYGSDGGLTLGQLQAVSKQLRELVVGNPFVGHASELRNAYILGDGIKFGAKKVDGDKPAKLTAIVRGYLERPRNVRYVFAPDAQAELGRAEFTDGMVFLMGDDATKDIQRLGIDQITGDLRNEENPEEIWAYRRQWCVNPGSGRAEIYRTEWIYTDIFDGVRPDAIEYGGKQEPVNRGKTIIDKRVNGQVGWAYGAPDGLVLVAWARLYKEFLVNGYVMSKALANFAYKVTVASNRQAQNAAVEVARPGEAGSTIVGPDLTPMATAGKGYDFASGEPLAAAMAAGAGINLKALLGTSETQEMDHGSRTMAIMRRKSWDQYYQRLFRWFGMPTTQYVTVTWRDLATEQIQRQMQAWTLAHNTKLFAPELIQQGIAATMDIAEPGPVPDFYAPPGAGATPGDPSEPGTTGSSGATGGSGQGQSTGTGSGLGNDHSTD